MSESEMKRVLICVNACACVLGDEVLSSSCEGHFLACSLVKNSVCLCADKC